jgi:hypothetical protein
MGNSPPMLLHLSNLRSKSPKVSYTREKERDIQEILHIKWTSSWISEMRPLKYILDSIGVHTPVATKSGKKYPEISDLIPF